MKSACLALLLACAPAALGDAPLADAVERGELARVGPLLAGGAGVNEPQVDGMRALHWAAHRGEAEIARQLLMAGADPNATNRLGVTPLSLACVNGDSRVVEALLEAGADPNTTQRGGETPLMTAARTGDPRSVRALLGRGAVVEARQEKGQTALMWAAAEGHAVAARLLIQAGADVHVALDGGFTPLLFAVREGRPEVVRVLLAAGADVNGAAQPKRRASRGPQAGMTPLLMAVENGHLELALELVDAGADPNDQRGGHTALHNLVWLRKPNHGEDEDGAPPPDGSGLVTSLQFARGIVARGADVNAQITKGPGGRGVLNRTGATPFLLAAQTADLPLLQLLLELGADPHLPNADGSTPLMAAAGYGTLAPGEVAGTESEAIEVAGFLLGLGADVNVVDRNGETAMHGAAYKSLPGMVEFLAARGAKPEIWGQKNRHGWTPLLIAEGYRPGNFKPSHETVEAIRRVLIASGVTPPPPTPQRPLNNDNYSPPAPATR